MRAGPDGVPGIPGAAGQDDRLLMVPGPAGAVRVLVADDQKEVRDGLCLLLGLLPGIEVIGAAIDGTDAARQAVAAGPDVISWTSACRTATGSRPPAGSCASSPISVSWC